MASGFTITISAVDKASRVMNDITKRVNGMNAPVRRFRGAFGRFMDASGVRRLAGAFRDWTAAGIGTAASLLKIIEPMGVLTGAASLAGLYKLTTAWAQFGTRLGFDAQRIGIMPQKLQAMQGAAEEAGASAGSMTTGLRSLHDTMVDAVGGRNNQALLYFRQLGINIGSMKGGVRDVTQVLPELADKIAAIKEPTLQARVATQLLGSAGEELLPYLRRGSQGMQLLESDARRLGLTNQKGVQAAYDLQLAQSRLGLATRGLAYSIAEKAAPGLQFLLNWFTDLIAANREAVGARIGQAVQTFARWLTSINWHQIGEEISGLAKDAQNVVERLGGWKAAGRDALIVIGGLYAMPVLAGLASLATAAFTVAGAVTAITWPAALAVAAVGVLGVAGYELWAYWDTVSKKFSGLWAGIKTAFQNNTAYVRTITETLFPIPATLINHWGHLGEFFSGLWDGIKTAFTAAWSYIAPIVDRVKKAIDFVANSWVGKKIAAAGATVEQGVTTGARRLGNYGRPVLDWYADTVDRATGYSHARGPLAAPVQAAAVQAAQRYGLDQDRFVSLLRQEHGGYANVSGAGAFGPAQLMPGTAKSLGLPTSVNDSRYTWQGNLDGGARYFKQMLDLFHGDYGAAEAAYNAGPNNAGVQRYAVTGDTSGLPHETQDYVRSINEMTSAAKRMQADGSKDAKNGSGSGTWNDFARRLTVDLRVHNDGHPQAPRVSIKGARMAGGGPAPKISTAMPSESM